MSMNVDSSSNKPNPKRYTMEFLNIKKDTYQASIFSEIDKSDGKIDGSLTEEQYQIYIKEERKHLQQTKKINLDQLYKNDKFFDNPKNTKIERNSNVIIRTEKYPNGEEKTRFYYRRIDDNRATIAIRKRSNNGNIAFVQEITVNDFSILNK